MSLIASSPAITPTFGGAAAPVRTAYASSPASQTEGDSFAGAATRLAPERQKPSLIRRAFLAPINAYQWITQNTIYRWMGNRGFDLCLYRKNGMFSCSEYTKLAIGEYGPLKGIWAGAKRIVSCNPLTAWQVEKLSRPLWDPIEVHGSYAEARGARPDFLKRTRRGRWFTDNISPTGEPTSRARA
ncbi:MAG: membrane protein insertion efficiency factor YidD [Vampirovibrionales bacterium]|nr:membrane protein insertion efficiency factor YidD [Vampirovibrionales bacterium]